MTDLDFWEVFGRKKKTLSYSQRNMTLDTKSLHMYLNQIHTCQSLMVTSLRLILDVMAPVSGSIMNTLLATGSTM